MCKTKKIKAIKEAVASGVLEALSNDEVDMLFSQLVERQCDTWLPPHIKAVKRETWLGATEIILYNSKVTKEEDALECDGYGSTVMVMDEAVFRRFFAKSEP